MGQVRRLDRKRWERVRREVFDRDGWKCSLCGKYGRLECDHLVPLERGGDPWDLDNLQALCRRCHLGKSRDEAREHMRPGARAWANLIDSRLLGH